MQKCRPLSFLCTNATALHHGLWLGQIVPTSNISFTCAWTSSTMGGGILWNLSLKGSSSTTLISCFARSVQPNSPGSREKISWYSANRAWTAAWFSSHHPSRPDRSSCWKTPPSSIQPTSQSAGYLTSHIASPRFQVPLPLGHCIHSYCLGDFNAFANSDQNGHQIFHYYCNLLAPSSHFSVGIHNTQAMRQAESITHFRVCIITCMLFPKSMVFVWPCKILDKKVSISSFFVVLTASFKSVRSTVWFAAASLLMESYVWWNANKQYILDPFKETDNSSILLSLITLMIWLMVGVPRVTGTWDPMAVESDMTRAIWSSS